MKTSCPFIYANFRCDETISKTKPFEVRIACYEDKCPNQMYEPLVCLNPTALDDQKRYIGGHCKVIINICENCKDLHKCKKSGDSKDTCRQQEIDQIFRQTPQAQTLPAKTEKQESTPKPAQKSEVLKDSLSKDIPSFPGKV